MIGNFTYIQNNLLKDEQLVYAMRPHWVIFAWSIWMLLFSFYVLLFASSVLDIELLFGTTLRVDVVIALLCIGGYSYLLALIYYKNAEYGVTNKRVVIKIGLIRRQSLEIMLDKVEAVMVDQTFFGRIFNYGRITIVGTGGTNDSYPYIPNPLEFRRQVQQQIDLHERSLIAR